MDYAILKNEMLPIVLQNKPRWITCVACTVVLLIVTLCAVSVGAFIGYTYCYMEHRRGFRTGNSTLATKLKIIDLPAQYDENDKRTINSVLFSSVLITRLVGIGQNHKDDISQLHLKNLNDSSFTTSQSYFINH